jgi:hypothetical protein
LLGDFNEQIQGKVPHTTGEWVGGPPSTNSEKIIQFLQINNLAAVSTMFKPKAHHSVCTFLQTTKSDKNNDHGVYVGHTVRAKYKHRWHLGVVEHVDTHGQGGPVWTVRFKDGYVKQYGETALRKIITRKRKKQIERQLDYIFEMITHY